VSNEVIIFGADTASAVTGTTGAISPLGTIEFTFDIFQIVSTFDLVTEVGGGTVHSLQFLQDAIIASNNGQQPVINTGPTFVGLYGNITFLTYIFDSAAAGGQLTYTYEYTANAKYVTGSPAESFTFILTTVPDPATAGFDLPF